MENIFGKFILFLLLVALIFNAPLPEETRRGAYNQKSEIHEENQEENIILFVIIVVIIVILVVWIFTEPNDIQEPGGEKDVCTNNASGNSYCRENNLLGSKGTQSC